MTGATFYTYCKRIFKRTDKETEFFEVLTDTIMDMKLRFNPEDFKEEAYTQGISTLGEYKFAVPSDFGHLIGDVVFRDTYRNSRQLKKLTKDSWDALYPYPGASDVTYAEPQHYCVYGKEIFIGPVPDKTSYTYLINYTTESATTITTDTTYVPFTDRYRWIVRDIVLGEFLAYLKQYDEASYYRSKGEIGLSKIIANEDNNIDTTVNVNYQDI